MQNLRSEEYLRNSVDQRRGECFRWIDVQAPRDTLHRMAPSLSPFGEGLTVKQSSSADNRAVQKEDVTDLLTRLESADPRIKYGSLKELRALAQEAPQTLCPYFDVFAQLMDHTNRILQWNSIIILFELASVDIQGKFEAFFRQYFSRIAGPEMITAAQVVHSASRIAKAKPHLADAVAAEVLKVGRGRYQTRECRNVVIGHALLSLQEMLGLLQKPAPVLRFVRRQMKNSRAATRVKAQRFLRRVAQKPSRR